MTVAELIVKLSAMPADATVWMQSDFPFCQTIEEIRTTKRGRMYGEDCTDMPDELCVLID